MLKSIEELNYSLRSKNGEFIESDEIERASKLQKLHKEWDDGYFKVANSFGKKIETQY